MTANTVSTYKDIVDEIMSLRFSNTATERSQAKRAVNARYYELWHEANWTFRQANSAVTVTSGSRTVTNLPADLETVVGLWDENGERLAPLTPSRFNGYTLGTTDVGTAEVFTVVNGVISVAPTPSATSSAWTLLYRKALTLMSSDTDEPAIPAGSRYLLVHGGLATMLAGHQDPSWQEQEQLWENGIKRLLRSYLSNIEGHSSTWAADTQYEWG